MTISKEKIHSKVITSKNSFRIGLGLFSLAIILSFIFECPSPIQIAAIYFVYDLGGILMFRASAEKSEAKIPLSIGTITLRGSIVVYLLFPILDPISHIKSNKCKYRIGVAINVIDEKATNPLKGKGYVVIYINSGPPVKEAINELGSAYFQNLVLGDKIRINVEFSEPYNPIYPDSIYTIVEDQSINLIVALRGIDKVQGKVISDDIALAGVLVQVKTFTDTTDENGSFFINIPKSEQTKEYEVWFSKEGFITMHSKYYPQTGEPLNIILPKKNE